MRQFIYFFVFLFGIYHVASSQVLVLTRKDFADSIINVAKREVGLRELTGRNDGKRIDEYRASVHPSLNLPRPRLPYCGCFVYWCFRQCGLKPAVANPARAANWFAVKRRLLKVPRHGNTRRAEGAIKKACVAGYKFQSRQNRISHVEFIELWGDEDDDTLIIIAGNTGSEGALDRVVREGDGVHRKKRKKKSVAFIADWME
jgi:hypothetical protein